VGGPGAAGVVLEGKYRLLEEIGTGAMGTVFRAWDESLDRPVAVKFLLPELESRRDLVRRFQREARAMAAVTHDNVAAIMALGTHGSAHFFVMEHIEGQSADVLLAAARRSGRMPPLHIVLKIIKQVCDGLAAVHRAGVVHRDIKPGNVIIETETGRAVITDFGLVRRHGKGEAAKGRGVGGTPGYLAPEVIAERAISEEADFLTDVYALGATAFELITGELPFNEPSVVLMLQAHLATPPRPPSSVRPEVPKALDDVVVRCLAKNPADRFQSCDAILRALAEVEIPVPPRRKSSPAPDPKPEVKRISSVRELAAPVRVLLSHPGSSRRKELAAAAREAIPSCRVWTASGGAEALRMAREHAPLVLVAAVEDPDLPGLELAAEVASDPRLKPIRLLMSAPSLSEGDRQLFQQLGVFDVLPEPSSREELVKTIRRSLKPKGGPSSPRRR
jgi:serine/threonine protein kinase